MNMCSHPAGKARVPVIAIIIFLVFAIECMAEPGIVNPISDFLSHRSIPVEDKLLKLETDLNHDGKKQIFLSLTYDTNAAEGNMWIVYLLKKDGTYIRVDQTDSGDAIEFRRDCYYIGKIPGVHGDVLAGYAHGGEETGSFFAYQFKNNAAQIVVGKEIHPFGADKKLFDKLFRGTPKAAVVDLDIPKQCKRHATCLLTGV